MKCQPKLTADAIHVWSVQVPDLLGQLDTLHALLSEKEQAKAARFHRVADRQSSIAARGALRILLSGYTGIPAAKLVFLYSENGKPSLVPPASSRPCLVSPTSSRPCLAPSASSRHSAGHAEHPGRQDACDTVSFNLSHSGDWVVLAFGMNCNLGVDIEKTRYGMDVLAIASRYFTPEETTRIENSDDPHALFFQLWARKEAYVKACGSALFRELNRIAVPMSGSRNGWFFQGLEVDPQYAAAVVADKPLGNVLNYGFGGLKWEN